MCLADKIFLQKHVTLCEYLVFHEFKRNVYISLVSHSAPSRENLVHTLKQLHVMDCDRILLGR